MFRTALRNVLAHKARLLMTVLAVTLGVAFVAGTLVFTSTVSAAYQNSSHKSFDEVDVAIRGGDPRTRTRTTPKLTRELMDRVARVPGVQSVTGVVSGFTAVAGKNGDLVGQGWTTQGANYVATGGARDARYPLKDGRAPHGPGEVVLDAKTAERAGYRVGESVRLSVDGPVRTPRLVGIFTTDSGEVAAGGTLALFDTPTAQQLFGMPGEFSEIDVKAAPGTSQTALAAAVGKVLPKELRTTTGRSLADSQAVMAESRTTSLQTTLLTFAGIALFVAIFLIANTFTMLVAQRTKELALLRAVGATRRQVTRSVLIEAFLVGLAAAVAGLVGGIGIGAAMRPLTSSFGNGGQTLPEGPLAITPAAVITSLVVGIGITMLAAWLPGRRAAKIPPVAAMSSVHAVATPRSLVVRNAFGALITAAGGIGVLGASGSTLDDGQMPMALSGAVLMTGVLVLTPLLSRPFIAAAAPLLRAFGVCGKLARENALRNPRRTAATASALTIGLTLITALTVVGVSSERSIDQKATAALSADYVVRMATYDPLSGTVEKRLGKVDGVSAVSPLRAAPARIAGRDTFVSGIDASTIRSLLRPQFTTGSLAGFGGRGIIVAKDTAQERGWHTGTTVPVTYPDGTQGELTVSGIFQRNDLLRGIVLDTRTLDPHVQTATAEQVLVKTEGGPSDTVKRNIAKALGDSPAVLVQSKQDVSDSIARSMTMMLNILYGLLAMAVLVAVLGVINTLAMSVAERAPEIGMLRAIGLDRDGAKRMVRLESLAISLFGGVLGIGLGVFLGWAGTRLLASDMPGFELVVPWGRLALFLTLSAMVGMLAALWPARRAARLNLLNAIKAE
ncbi:ABC transporter permease [Streptomyces sp. RS10V-4]|uniref:ABC transporter permease n=1 Tax=Streptomyces rhizoryzae TaxID=2932493 RepID=UPI0020038617|nr:ABC transporter permease [Streptomyces rhizoryzae]MCK7621848.1 ABC transporter permease [Streptomyces rhizoryzae]